jgi:hypothetical protein
MFYLSLLEKLGFPAAKEISATFEDESFINMYIEPQHWNLS